MEKDTLKINEKEFAVIKEISNNHQPDQRAIASKTGISLGMTNLIIKRLIKKGYLKAKQLNKRKIQYILTPKGFAEKAKKSYWFTIKTINTLTKMKQKIQEIINNEYNSGRREFIICGNGEIINLIEVTMKEMNTMDIKYARASEINDITFKSPFYLYTDGNMKKPSKNGINVILALSEYS
ncbi:MAG: winged helix-turn-helix transcriptional regulator [Elusimicrobiota bacterium]